MPPRPYSEDQLCEEPAVALFASFGWPTVNAADEIFGPDGTLGRDTPSEVVLIRELRVALNKLNPGVPTEAISAGIDELARDRSAMSLGAANREVYRLLKEGIVVSLPDREHGGEKTERLRIIDWKRPGQNDFLPDAGVATR